MNDAVPPFGVMVSRSGKKEWCPGAESNHRHCDFQSHALPTELPGHIPARWSGALTPPPVRYQAASGISQGNRLKEAKSGPCPASTRKRRLLDLRAVLTRFAWPCWHASHAGGGSWNPFMGGRGQKGLLPTEVRGKAPYCRGADFFQAAAFHPLWQRARSLAMVRPPRRGGLVSTEPALPGKA